MEYKWKEDLHDPNYPTYILCEFKDDQMTVLGYIRKSLNWKVRKLQPAGGGYKFENLQYDAIWNRENVCQDQPTKEEAQKALLTHFGIAEIVNQDILKFLAKLQNIEVFGKLEITIKVEHVNVEK